MPLVHDYPNLYAFFDAKVPVLKLKEFLRKIKLRRPSNLRIYMSNN